MTTSPNLDRLQRRLDRLRARRDEIQDLIDVVEAEWWAEIWKLNPPEVINWGAEAFVNMHDFYTPRKSSWQRYRTNFPRIFRKPQ